MWVKAQLLFLGVTPAFAFHVKREPTRWGPGPKAEANHREFEAKKREAFRFPCGYPKENWRLTKSEPTWCQLRMTMGHTNQD